MSQKHQSGQRLQRAAGIAFACLALASGAAIAQEAPVQSNEALTVVRDADTGKLRNATAAEQAALTSQANSNARLMRVAPKATQQKIHASGARGARLTDEFMSTSVAVRAADGSLDMQCFDSHGAASSATTAGHVHTNKVETE